MICLTRNHGIGKQLTKDKRLRHPTPGDGISFSALTTTQMQQGDLLIWIVIIDKVLILRVKTTDDALSGDIASMIS